MPHPHMYRQVESLRFQQVCNAPDLLERQVIERRKSPKLGIMCGDLSYTRLGCGVLTHNALDKTRGLIPWTGFALAAAPWCRAAKSNE